MSRPLPLLIAALGIAAFLGGLLAGRAAVADSSQSASSGAEPDRPARKSAARTGASEREKLRASAPPARSSIRSTDTLDTLTALSDDALYGRLALWLMDASTEEIAAYWEHHKGRESRKRDITDLIMIGWTRVDPQGAIAAVSGTNDEHFAWWAWSCHDPAAALQTAIDTSPNRIGNVAWGIGEFHPKWLRENFERLPEGARGNALQGLVKWGEVDDAMATLEFLNEHGRTPNQELLKNLVRQDPWAAFEWIEQNATRGSSVIYGPFGEAGSANDALLAELADSHPDVLQRLIAQQPSGEQRRQMEAAAFEHLLGLDLEAALEQAQSTESPVVSAGRMASVGLHLLRADPDRAFEVAAELFARHPGALQNHTRIRFPNGSESSSRGSDGSAGTLLDALVAQDPARAMAMFPAEPQETAATGATVGASGGAVIGAAIGSSYYGNPFGGSALRDQVAGRWAAQDLEGFAQWVVDQDDPALTDRSAPAVMGQLQNQHRFEEAAQWALAMESQRSSQLHNLLRNWQQVDPERARQWFESAALPETEAAYLRDVFSSQP